MAVDVAAIVATLEAEYLSLVTQIGALPAADVSSGGRSISASGARAALQARIDAILKQLAQLGSPVGTIGKPLSLRSRIKS